MSNMSYCRFQNTYADLVDCRDALDEDRPLSEAEYEKAKQLIELCQEIAEGYSPDDLHCENEDECPECGCPENECECE